MVARSSAEVEFSAVAHGVWEILWIKRLPEELKSKASCDNKAAITIAHNSVLYDRMKHVKVDKHFIKLKLLEGLICMLYILT